MAMFGRSEPRSVQKIGKTATTVAELEEQANEYLNGRFSKPQGFWSEGRHGLTRKTLPIMLGRRPSFWAVLALLFKISNAFGTAMFAILLRRESAAVSQGHTPQLSTLLGGLTSIDYLFGAIGVGFYAGPKLVDLLTPKSRTNEPSAHRALELGISLIPSIEGTADQLHRCRQQVLIALRDEMAILIDDSAQAVTDVTLLEYTNADCTHMHVAARTADAQGINRDRPACLFLAHHVAKRGRWFAEHNFTGKANPFRSNRISVPGDMPVTYESVLFMPIMSRKRIDQDPAAIGPVRQVDCCLGIICVHTEKPYRFWNWGDHKKLQGKGGMGSIAMQRANPYISLITKLLDGTANSIEVESSDV